MACSATLSGIQKGCNDNVGGIKYILVNNASAISGITASAGSISAITKTAVFKKYEFNKQSSQFTTTITSNDVNDSLFFQTDLVVKFNKLEAAKNVELFNLAKGELVAIVADNNGKYWYMGKDNEISVTAGTAMSGTAFGDASGYEITFQDIAKEPLYEVASGIIATLLA